jgi:hypothetical protein
MSDPYAHSYAHLGSEMGVRAWAVVDTASRVSAYFELKPGHTFACVDSCIWACRAFVKRGVGGSNPFVGSHFLSSESAQVFYAEPFLRPFGSDGGSECLDLGV